MLPPTAYPYYHRGIILHGIDYLVRSARCYIVLFVSIFALLKLWVEQEFPKDCANARLPQLLLYQCVQLFKHGINFGVGGVDFHCLAEGSPENS